MTGNRYGQKRSRSVQPRRHDAVQEIAGAPKVVYQPGLLTRVAGALADRAPNTDRPFEAVTPLIAETVGESHGIGLSVLWTVVRDNNRPPHVR